MPERDRAEELLRIVDRCHGFGTVVITVSGSVLACSLADLREAIRRRAAAARDEAEIRHGGES